MTFTHLKQPPKSSLCGQTCVAMATGISIEESVKLFKSKGGTRTKQVLKVLESLGIGSIGDKLQVWDGVSDPPRFALMKTVFYAKGEKGNHSHWILNWDGRIHDPECNKPGLFYGRMTSFVELIPPAQEAA